MMITKQLTYCACIGQSIKRARERCRMSLIDLKHKSNLTTATIKEMEAGTAIDFQDLDALLSALDISAEALITQADLHFRHVPLERIGNIVEREKTAVYRYLSQKVYDYWKIFDSDCTGLDQWIADCGIVSVYLSAYQVNVPSLTQFPLLYQWMTSFEAIFSLLHEDIKEIEKMPHIPITMNLSASEATIISLLRLHPQETMKQTLIAFLVKWIRYYEKGEC